MKKQRIYRKFEVAILVVLIFSFIGSFLNNYLLPIKFKSLFQKTAAEALKKPVYFENIGFSLIRGVTVDNITIFDTEEKKEIFLKARRVSFNPLFIPLLSKKKLIITNLIITNLELNLQRNKEGRLNLLETFLSKETQREKENSHFSIIVTDLGLKNSIITLKDDFPVEQQITVLENVNAAIHFSLPYKVKFNFSSSLKNKAEKISLKGTYFLTNKYLVVNLNGLDLNLYKFSPYFGENLSSSFKKGTADIAATITFNTDKKVLSIDGTSYLNEMEFNFVSLVANGNIVVKGKTVYDLKNNSLINAKGSIILRGVGLSGILYVDKLEDIEGAVNFTSEGLFIEKLNAKMKTMPLDLQGHLKNFRSPELKLTVKSDLKLRELKNQLPPEIAEKLKDLAIEGASVLQLELQGKLKKFWSFDFSGNAELTDVVLKSAASSIEINNIDSKLNFSKDKLTIDSLTMEFKNTPYSITAVISGFSQPLLNFKLTSADLFTTGEIQFSPQTAQIKTLSGKYKDMDFAASGHIYDFSDPILKINTKLNSNIENLKNIFPSFEKNIQKLKLGGTISSSLDFEGKIKDPLNGTAKITASSQKVSIAGFEINNAMLTSRLQQKSLVVDELRADVYDGYLILNGNCDIQNIKQSKFQTALELSNVNLSKLVKGTKLEEKKIKGTARLKGSMTGNLNDTKSFAGTGSLGIKDGYLWGTPALNKVLDNLIDFLQISDLKNTTFKEVSGSYQIKDGIISTPDLTLSSDELFLIASGNLSFDGKLDFLIKTQLSQAYYDSLTKKRENMPLSPVILNGIAKYLLNIKVGGTLSEPETKLDFALEGILKEDLIKGLEKIFENF